MTDNCLSAMGRLLYLAIATVLREIKMREREVRWSGERNIVRHFSFMQNL